VIQGLIVCYLPLLATKSLKEKRKGEGKKKAKKEQPDGCSKYKAMLA